MKCKLIKIVGWTVGMALAVFLITDGKMETFHPLRHALIGAVIGLALGFTFAGNKKHRMELCGLSKTRPISCSDSPAFHRRQT